MVKTVISNLIFTKKIQYEIAQQSTGCCYFEFWQDFILVHVKPQFPLS